MSDTPTNIPFSFERLITQEPFTKERLLSISETSFGFDQETTKNILLNHGYTTFRRDNWSAYLVCLRDEFAYRENMKSWPECCPICGSKVIRDTSRDGLFGAKLGWTCTVNRIHFMEARVNVIKGNWLVKVPEEEFNLYHGVI